MEENKQFITRVDAVKAIYSVINSGIISEELEQELQDVVNCIEAESDNLFLWGADGEVIDLFTSRRADLIDDSWINHCHQLYNKYKIREVEPKKDDEE